MNVIKMEINDDSEIHMNRNVSLKHEYFNENQTVNNEHDDDSHENDNLINLNNCENSDFNDCINVKMSINNEPNINGYLSHANVCNSIAILNECDINSLQKSLSEKSAMIEQIHLQLDNSISTNEELNNSLSEKCRDLERAENIIGELKNRLEKCDDEIVTLKTKLEASDTGSSDVKVNDNSIEKKLIESEERLNKFKALAMKLKKELNETKDQLSKSNAECNNLKSQLKGIEKNKDKLSLPYQQLIQNYQSLQEEYDKLQDERDVLTKNNKSIEQEFANVTNELTRIREENAEKGYEIENEKKMIMNLESERDVNHAKLKDFESKLIVLNAELESERKKNVANTGLEQSLIELRNQLDIKTTEIVELNDHFEISKTIQSENETLKLSVNEMSAKIEEIESENKRLNEYNSNINEQLERNILENENHKLRSSELISQIQTLEDQLKNVKDLHNKGVKSFESQLSELRTQMKIQSEEIRNKDSEFDNYKARVCKVLKQQQTPLVNNHENHKEIEELTNTVKSLNLENSEINSKLNELRKENEILEKNLKELNLNYDSLKNQLIENVSLHKRFEESSIENEKLKSFARELQSSLVKERLEFEKSNKLKLQEMEDLNKAKIALLEEEIRTANHELDKLRRNLSQHLYEKHDNDKLSSIPDDLESVETMSLTAKRLSISSNSIDHSINPLEEILNPIERHDNKSVENFTVHLTEAQNKVENLTQLLEESESGNVLLSEQNRVLKEEIRRMQRCAERLEIAENLEYLKNILLKFVSLSGGDERSHLVPVISTILKLSPEEQSVLQNVASVEPSQSTQYRWSNYLWSGNR